MGVMLGVQMEKPAEIVTALPGRAPASRAASAAPRTSPNFCQETCART
jgi:hypothetical protein